jgi:hypothetical protein
VSDHVAWDMAEGQPHTKVLCYVDSAWQVRRSGQGTGFSSPSLSYCTAQSCLQKGLLYCSALATAVHYHLSSTQGAPILQMRKLMEQRELATT